VLYVLDGDLYFATATEAVRDLKSAGIVVVGIGYPDRPAFVAHVLKRRGPVSISYGDFPPSRVAHELERIYDFTLAASERELAAQGLQGAAWQKSSNVGGLDDFLETIETEVKPRVAALLPTNPADQALFGHSLGGLAVLHALFVEPNAYRTFIIASPSIWWNDKAVLADEPKFADAVGSGRASPRVLVTIGSDESTVPNPIPASWGVTRAALEARWRKIRMVDNARELTARLKALHGTSNYHVEDFAVFDKQAHTLSAWPALARGVSFAFPDAY
jgi:predicted alpha/beta superfamily hydrolase